MVVYSDTKIYVLCPGNSKSGTADNCHQLCSALIKFGIETFMLYLPGSDNFNPENPVDEIYKKYHIPYDNGVEDSEKNILIVPEIAANFLYFTKKTRRILWWLNINVFLRDIAVKTADHFENILTRPMPRFFSFNRYDSDIEHWAQSEYAKNFLKINGVPDAKIFTVTDFLDNIFFNSNTKSVAKKNLVAYRKIQGRDFSEVVKDLSDVEWQAVENVNPAVVKKLFDAAKIYVDFGEHPAKDKLTREAAISNCVVITGKRGAAGNDVDINIPDEFKFEETITDAKKIAKKIKSVLKNPEASLAKQKAFREKILREKNLFEGQIKTALGIKPSSEITVVIFGGLNDKISMAIGYLLYAGFSPKFLVTDNFNLYDKNIYTENNIHYLNLEDTRLQIISSNDAQFLYGEGRINKFLNLGETKTDFVDTEDIIG